MVILLTDGTSNTGIEPATAAGEAAKAKIPVNTVGVGQRNQTTMLQGRVVDGVDEQGLQQISSATGGHYYYAADEAQLSKIYSDLGSRIGWVTTKLDLTVPRSLDRKSTRLNSSHRCISYAVFCLKKKTSSAPRQPGQCVKYQRLGDWFVAYMRTRDETVSAAGRANSKPSPTA